MYRKVSILMMFAVAVCMAGDVTIEQVNTYANDSKSSVVIRYTGSEELQYFTVDESKTELVLDLPGVYSNVDFSGLSFPQVRSVTQQPLDPDENKGISVRFHLIEGATHHIFNDGAGSMTLFFESPEGAPVSTVAGQSTMTYPDTAQVLEGKAGDRRFSRLVVNADGNGGVIYLEVDALDKYSHFSLVEPDRYVIDLKETVLSLPANELLMDNPLISRIRIRQFQSQPSPITRLVLDLKAEAVISPTKTAQGLAIAFAGSNENLSDVLAVAKTEAPKATPVLEDTAVAVVEEPAQAAPATAVAAPEQAEPPRRRVRTSVQYVTKREKDVDREVKQFEEQADPVEPEVVTETIEEEPLMEDPTPVVADTSTEEVQADDIPVLETTAVTEDTPVLMETIEEAPSAAEQGIAEAATEDISAAGSTDTVSTETTEAVVATPAATPVEEDEPIVASVAQDAVVQPAPAEAAPPVEAQVEVVESDPEPVATEQIAEVTPAPVEAEAEVVTTEVEADTPEAVTEPKPATADTWVTADQQTAAKEAPVAEEAPFQEERLSDEDRGLMTPTEQSSVIFKEEKSDGEVFEASVEAPESITDLFEEAKRQIESENPNFEMASDLDLDLPEVDEQDDPKTFYGMMRGVKSNRANIGRVIVTDKAIAKSLTETSNMQDELDEASPDELEELFQSSSDPDALGTRQYRGFEIAIIDVRDQPVLDLLRFIAEEVGINLYVDPSVGDSTATYRFRNMPWDQVLDIILTNAGLEKEFTNGVLRIATIDKFRREAADRKALRIERETSVPTEIVYRSLNYARAEDVVQLVDSYTSSRGTILIDERTNTLIIEDIPSRLINIRTLIDRLDVMIAQVTIEARIVETNTRFLRELGIQWGLTANLSPETGTDTGSAFPNRVGVGGPVIGLPASPLTGPEGGYAINFPVVTENVSGIGLTLGNFLDNFKLDISMQLLESDGQGKIISSPKITTQNNKSAVIRNGTRLPIQTLRQGTITTRLIDALLELEVTPQITSDETIIMDLIVDKSEPDFSRIVLGQPVILVSRAETKVLVKNGGTAVIGGIFTLNDQNTSAGIPYLRQVPILKRLFGSERREYTNQELLIFVTPRIVKY